MNTRGTVECREQTPSGAAGATPAPRSTYAQIITLPAGRGELGVTLDQQIAAAKREIGMRNRVYLRRVHYGEMTQSHADLEIAAMTAILKTLQSLKQGELL